MKSNLQHVPYPLAKIPKLTARAFTIQWEEFRMIGVGALLLLLTLLAEPLRVFEPLRLLLGVVYVLFVPGYCLTTALFPKRNDLERVEWVGLSLGLSIAAIPLLALLLDRSPWGLQLWPILYGELGIVAVGAAITLVRRAQLSPRPAHKPQARAVDISTDALGRWQVRLMGRRFYTTIAGLFLLLMLLLVWFWADPLMQDQRSEFYMLGEEGLAEQYPQALVVDEALTMTLGIANRERGTRTYTVEIWAQDPWSTQRGEIVARAGPFQLAAGEEIQQPVEWAMPRAGPNQEVTFLLFMSEQTSPEPYRQLRLLVDVVEQ